MSSQMRRLPSGKGMAASRTPWQQESVLAAEGTWKQGPLGPCAGEMMVPASKVEHMRG